MQLANQACKSQLITLLFHTNMVTSGPKQTFNNQNANIEVLRCRISLKTLTFVAIRWKRIRKEIEILSGKCGCTKFLQRKLRLIIPFFMTLPSGSVFGVCDSLKQVRKLMPVFMKPVSRKVISVSHFASVGN